MMPASVFFDFIRLLASVTLCVGLLCLLVCIGWWVYCFIVLVIDCSRYEDERVMREEVMVMTALDELDRLFEEKEGE